MRLIRRVLVLAGIAAAMWAWRESMLRRNEATWADIHQLARS